MDKVDVGALMEAMRPQLEKDAAEGKLNGLTMNDLQDAMSHPKAAGVVANLVQREAPSVQQGHPAPNFTLPWLSNHAGKEGETMTLSDHFGKRPVALIFGSYT